MPHCNGMVTAQRAKFKAKPSCSPSPRCPPPCSSTPSLEAQILKEPQTRSSSSSIMSCSPVLHIPPGMGWLQRGGARTLGTACLNLQCLTVPQSGWLSLRSGSSAETAGCPPAYGSSYRDASKI
eukprot:1160391-Pelagomonas_calceolata.AAC.4